MQSISIKSILFTGVLFLLVSTGAMAQKKGVVTTSFWVGGVCDMCEERIEKTLDVKGVVFVDYHLNNHQLDITYKQKKISEDQIHALLNRAGHDTEKSKATDEQYGAIHKCCKYREHEHNH